MAKISQTQLRSIIAKAPPGSSPEGIVEALRAEGHEVPDVQPSLGQQAGNIAAGAVGGAGVALKAAAGIGTALGGGGVALLAQNLLNRRGGAAGRIKLTKQMIQEFPELSRYKAGETISAAQLDKIKLGQTGSAASRATKPTPEREALIAEQEARVERTQAMKPRGPGGKILPATPRMFHVEPMRTRPAPSTWKDVRPLERPSRPKTLATPEAVGRRGRNWRDVPPKLRGEPIPGTVAAVKPGSPDPELWRTRGISAPRGATVGSAALRAGLGALPFLLQGATADRDIEEAQRIFREANIQRQRDESTREQLRRLFEPQGI